MCRRTSDKPIRAVSDLDQPIKAGEWNGFPIFVDPNMPDGLVKILCGKLGDDGSDQLR